MSDAIGEMKIYSLRVYNRCLTANDRAWNKSVDDKRFMGLLTTNLVVTAENGESVGPVDPAYGAYTDIRTGTYYECSAAATGNFGGAAYKCLGYSLYTNDATGAWREWRSDATNRVMVCQTSNTVKLVWHWKRENGMTVIVR